jgi:hypothetical protein
MLILIPGMAPTSLLPAVVKYFNNLIKIAQTPHRTPS